VCVGSGTCVESGAHRGTDGKEGVREEFCKAGEALIEDEALMGTAASRGCWREAQRKQSMTSGCGEVHELEGSLEQLEPGRGGGLLKGLL
jgi:hypothetical protein